jgi:hypothetical protein
MIYTCPMHPQIQQGRPGICPICGMTLEPRSRGVGVGVGDEEEQREVNSLSRKFWIALVLTIPVLVLAMGHEIPGLHIDAFVPTQIGKWIEFGLTTPVVLWAGGFFFARAWQSIVNRSLNMFTLIAVGVGTAYFYSAAAVIVPGIFPESFRRHGEVDLYFEAAAVITKPTCSIGRCGGRNDLAFTGWSLHGRHGRRRWWNRSRSSRGLQSRIKRISWSRFVFLGHLRRARLISSQNRA